MKKISLEKISVILCSIAFLFFAVNFASVKANAEEVSAADRTVSYCLSFSTMDPETIPDKVYYSLEYCLGGEEAEMPMMPVGSGEQLSEATYSDNGCFSFSFDEAELEAGKVLRIVWDNEYAFWNADVWEVKNYDFRLTYGEWCDKRTDGTLAQDGYSYNVVENFYDTCVIVSVDDKGILSWESALSKDREWTVAIYKADNTGGALEPVNDDIHSGSHADDMNGFGSVTGDNGEAVAYYFSKSAGKEYFITNEDGTLTFDVETAIKERFNDEQDEYFAGVFVEMIASNGQKMHTQSGAIYDNSGCDELLGVSAYLDGYFVQVYYVDLSKNALAADNMHMEFYVDGVLQDSSFEGKDEWIGGYKFYCNIPMTKLNAPIHAYLCYGETRVDFGEHTAKEYIDRVRPGLYDKRHMVVDALLNYAGYAQKYFEIYDRGLVNEGLYTEENDPVKSLDRDTIIADLSDINNIEGTLENEDMKLAGMSLVSRSNTAVKLYFAPKNGMTAEQLLEKYNYLWINSAGIEESTMGISGGYFYVRHRGVSAFRLLDDKTNFVIKEAFDAEDAIDITLQPGIYIKNVMETYDDGALVDMCKALYLYAKAADDYMSDYQ